MNIEEQAYRLWKLLDDIDTLDDSCKGDDAMFRALAYKMQRRRFDVLSGEQFDVLSARFTPPQPSTTTSQ